MKWKQLIYWRISCNQSFTSARTVMQRHLPLRVALCVCECESHSLASVVFKILCENYCHTSSCTHEKHLLAKFITMFSDSVFKYFLCYFPQENSLYTRMPMCLDNLSYVQMENKVLGLESPSLWHSFNHISSGSEIYCCQRGLGWWTQWTHFALMPHFFLFIYFLVMKWYDRTDWGLVFQCSIWKFIKQGVTILRLINYYLFYRVGLEKLHQVILLKLRIIHNLLLFLSDTRLILMSMSD